MYVCASVRACVCVLYDVYDCASVNVCVCALSFQFDVY